MAQDSEKRKTLKVKLKVLSRVRNLIESRDFSSLFELNRISATQPKYIQIETGTEIETETGIETGLEIETGIETETETNHLWSKVRIAVCRLRQSRHRLRLWGRSEAQLIRAIC